MSPSAPTKRALPMLDSVRVASPCSADWAEMIGDEKVRFCSSCEKNVYNLSAMTSADAEHLLGASAGGELCVRFYQRADGTVMTADCPVGVKRKRRKKLALAVAGAGALAWGAVAQLDKQRTMGAVATTGEVAVQGAPIEMPPRSVTTVAVPVPQPPIMGTASAQQPQPPIETKGKLAVDPPRSYVMGGIPPVQPPPKPEPVVMGRRAPSPTPKH